MSQSIGSLGLYLHNQKNKSQHKLKYLGKYERLIGPSANVNLEKGTIVKMYRIKDSKKPPYYDLIVINKNIQNSTIMTEFVWKYVG